MCRERLRKDRYYKSNHSIFWIYVDIYRVAGLSCPEAGGCKSAILRRFSDVFGLFVFGPFKLGNKIDNKIHQKADQYLRQGS